MVRAPTPQLTDGRLLDAAERVLLADGWDGLSIERVAAEAGLSRVTAWRQGATKDTIVDALITRLGADYRTAMWPVLTASGTGAQRLQQALGVLCHVAERHLPLLLASDMVFHQDSSRPVDFTEPLVRLVSDGRADGSLHIDGTDGEIATTLFNTVCWPYVHLRGRHHWSAAKTRTHLLRLVIAGIAAPSGRGGKPRVR
jgi:AcrR family transcriptional regulator